MRRMAFLMIVAMLPLVGCGYGEISSTGYAYAKALYSLSNLQSADRVDDVQAQIDTAAEAGELPGHEAEWLRDICEQCRTGDWESAQADARKMMMDQVEH